MIRRLTAVKTDDHTIILDAMICCQNPTLNPMQMALAIETYLPAQKPDFTGCHRIEVYDGQETIFR